MKIRKLRCGQPIAAAQNEHTDVCPATGTGGNAPSAYHAPAGTIVTCPSFWNAMNNQFASVESRKDAAARTLVHEVFHWLSVDDCPSRRTTCARHVSDYHGDGVGGIPDRYWKGADRAREPARRAPRLATRNNDNYAYFVYFVYFVYDVATSKPYVHGVWVPQSGGSRDDYSHVHMLPWNAFVAQWRARAADFALVDISTYVSFGTRLYSGLWHKDPGRNGALFYLTSWQSFVDKWRELNSKQELVDVEGTAAEGRPGRDSGACPPPAVRARLPLPLAAGVPVRAGAPEALQARRVRPRCTSRMAARRTERGDEAPEVAPSSRTANSRVSWHARRPSLLTDCSRSLRSAIGESLQVINFIDAPGSTRTANHRFVGRFRKSKKTTTTRQGKVLQRLATGTETADVAPNRLNLA